MMIIISCFNVYRKFKMPELPREQQSQSALGGECSLIASSVNYVRYFQSKRLVCVYGWSTQQHKTLVKSVYSLLLLSNQHIGYLIFLHVYRQLQESLLVSIVAAAVVVEVEVEVEA
jgi:hypothetical protein